MSAQNDPHAGPADPDSGGLAKEPGASGQPPLGNIRPAVLISIVVVAVIAAVVFLIITLANN